MAPPRTILPGSSSRSKRRNTGEGSSESISVFVDQKASKDWEYFQGLQICSGRKVNLSFEQNGFIADYLLDMGWYNLLEVDEFIFPELVKMFYCNLRTVNGPNGFSLTSRINGIDVMLDVVSLGGMLGISSDGEHFYTNQFSELYAKFAQGTVLSTLCAKELTDRFLKKLLKRKLILINQFIMDNITPRRGCFTDVYANQALVLFCCASSYKICLPYIMLKEMEYAVRKKKSLPYGIYLSKLFKAWNIDLSNTEWSKLKAPINSKTVKQAFREFDEEDEAADAEAEVEAAQEEQMDVPESAAGQGSGQGRSLDDLYDRFNHFSVQTSQNFAEVHGKLDAMFAYFNIPPYHHPPPPPEP